MLPFALVAIAWVGFLIGGPETGFVVAQVPLWLAGWYEAREWHRKRQGVREFQRKMREHEAAPKVLAWFPVSTDEDRLH